MININLPEFNSEIHFEHTVQFHAEMLKKSICRVKWLFEMLEEKCPQHKEDINELRFLADKLLCN